MNRYVLDPIDRYLFVDRRAETMEVRIMLASLVLMAVFGMAYLVLRHVLTRLYSIEGETKRLPKEVFPTESIYVAIYKKLPRLTPTCDGLAAGDRMARGKQTESNWTDAIFNGFGSKDAN
ncbi:unnamed protein product [Arctia plantaginis]|uniref:Uncharacterized protein n=1 Tax=Arctia plantaginis TaxID=874455 RepID=A0A8S1B1C1_ARCPL|nr:unnamed protein product [Arctia plantaginis]